MKTKNTDTTMSAVAATRRSSDLIPNQRLFAAAACQEVSSLQPLQQEMNGVGAAPILVVDEDESGFITRNTPNPLMQGDRFVMQCGHTLPIGTNATWNRGWFPQRTFGLVTTRNHQATIHVLPLRVSA